MTQLQRWEHRSEWPLIGISVLFLLGYAIPIVQPAIPPAVASACSLVVLVSWVLFGGDYVVRLALAEHKWRFVRTNVVDLAVIALPSLRPLRLLRLVALLSVLNRSGATSLRGKVITYITGGAVLLVLCAGLAITEAERNAPDSSIVGFGDGIWWALTTVTTVGYGDTYPATTTGRVIAVALMLGGIALLGVVTATLASWMVERVAETNDADQAATRAHVEALANQIEALRSEIAEHRTADR